MTTNASAGGLPGCSTAARRLSGVSLDYVSSPRIGLPARSCDCHVHIFEPVRYPYIPERTYTPGTATVEDLLAFEDLLGIERVVLVQPSGYGNDNRCLVAALQQLGSQRARGVAVIDVHETSTAEIDALHQAGVRSIRINLEVKGEQSAERARALLQRALDVVAQKKWSIQLYADLQLIESLADTIALARTPIVLDHFAGLKAERGLEQSGFARVLDLMRLGQVYVKLSAPYRASQMADYADLQPFVRAFAAAAPAQLVWASDWPHTGSAAHRSGDLSEIEAFRRIDSGKMLDQLAHWMGRSSSWQQMLVDNPARLYDFA